MVSPVGGRLRGVIAQAKDFVTRCSKCSGIDVVNRLAIVTKRGWRKIKGDH
jgi:hypothetical protein